MEAGPSREPFLGEEARTTLLGDEYNQWLSKHLNSTDAINSGIFETSLNIPNNLPSNIFPTTEVFLSITGGNFGLKSSTEYYRTKIYNMKLSPNGRYLIIIYSGYTRTVHIKDNYILLDLNRLIQLLDQYSDSTDQIKLASNDWLKSPILSYNNRAKSLIFGDLDNAISDPVYIGFLDDQHLLTIRDFQKYSTDETIPTVYDIYHIPSQTMIDTGRNISTDSVKHGDFLFSGGYSRSYYRWHESKLTKMETSTMYSFPYSSDMKYIFKDVQSDKLMRHLLNKDTIKSDEKISISVTQCPLRETTKSLESLAPSRFRNKVRR